MGQAGSCYMPKYLAEVFFSCPLLSPVTVKCFDRLFFCADFGWAQRPRLRREKYYERKH